MKKIILVTILALIVTTSYAQDSLMVYLDMAVKMNPTVLQRYAEYEASLQKVPQVGSLPNPELSLGVFLSPMELVGGQQIADIRLMQMFPWFGVLKNAKDEMSLMAKAKFEVFRDAKLQVYYQVQETWYQLYKTQQNISITEVNIELLGTIERLVTIKYQVGTAGGSSISSKNTTEAPSSSSTSGMTGMSSNTPSNVKPTMAMNVSSLSGGLADVYQVQIEANELQNKRDGLVLELRVLKAQFNSLLNRPLDTSFDAPTSLEPDYFAPSQTALLDSIKANNPMLNMLHYEQKSLEARQQMVTKMGYPMIGIGLNYALVDKSAMSSSPMNGNDMIMPMVTVSLPIYRKNYKAKRNEVKLLSTANLHNTQATSNLLETEYYKAQQKYLDAQRRMNLYDKQYLITSKILAITMQSFVTSNVSLSEVIRLQQQQNDYQYKQVEATTDYYAAVAWLKRLMDYTPVH